MSDITKNYYSKKENSEMDIEDQPGLRSKYDKKECCKCFANIRGNRGWVQGCGHLLCSGCTLNELQNGKNACPVCETEVHYGKSQVMYFPIEDDEKEEAVEENDTEEYQEYEYSKQKTREEESKTENIEGKKQITIGEKDQYRDGVKEKVIEEDTEKETPEDYIKKENIEDKELIINKEKEQMTVKEKEQIKVLEKEQCTEEKKNEDIQVDAKQETQEHKIKNYNTEEREEIMDEKKEQMIVEDEEQITVEEEDQFTDKEKEEATKGDDKERTPEDAIKKENIEEKRQIIDEGIKQISVEDHAIKGKKKETTAGIKKKSMEIQANLNRIGFCQPLVPSSQLAEFLKINEGHKITTSECVKKTLTYIKNEKLQCYKDRYDEYGFVKPNKEMVPIFGYHPFKSMYIQKYIMKHLHK